MCVSPSLPLRSCVLAFNDLPNLETTKSNSGDEDSQHTIVALLQISKSSSPPTADTMILSELSGTEHVSQIISIYATLLEDTLCPCLLIQDASSSPRPSRKCKSCHELVSSMFRQCDDYYQPPVLSCCPKLPDLDGTSVDDDSVASYDSLESSPIFIPAMYYPSEHTTTSTAASPTSPLLGDESPASIRCPKRFRQS